MGAANKSLTGLVLVLAIGMSAGECGRMTSGKISIEGCAEVTLTAFEQFLALSKADRDTAFGEAEKDISILERVPDEIDGEFQVANDAIEAQIEEVKKAGNARKDELPALQEKAKSTRKEFQARVDVRS